MYGALRRAMRRFVSGPTIAALILRHRMRVNEDLRAGKYGRLFRIGRIVYVALPEVERVEGRQFSEKQIELATAGLPDRILIIPDNQKEGACGPSR